MRHASQWKLSDLPATLAVFPLPGALLFPRWQLPLNIFEPRYLNMVDDVMAGDHLIGMIQPVGGPKARPALAGTGAAGRITSWQETEDGRYLITLTGLARFRVAEEVHLTKPYRLVRPDWTPYSDDLRDPHLDGLPARARLLKALRKYTIANNIHAVWKAVEDAPMETLVNALCAGCPFSVMEKQALLEAPALKDRAETLITLLEMDVSGHDGGMLQ